MIVGDITRWQTERASLSPVIGRAIDYLLEQHLEELEQGTYEIDGPQFFYMIKDLETKPAAELFAENHEQFVDIHYVISGEERIGFARDHGGNAVVKDEIGTRDYRLFAAVADETEFVLRPGMYAVMFPADIHRPCCRSGETGYVRKAVVKIHLDVLNGSMEPALAQEAGERG